MDKTKTLTLVSTIAFAISSFVSLAVGNITLGVAVVSSLFNYSKCIVPIKKEYRNFFVSILIFLFTMLLSALFSGDLFKGFKTWADLWIWRMMPFVIIVFLISKKEDANKVLYYSAIGITIGIVCVLYQGMHGNYRASGFFGHPMTFAGWLCLYLPVFLIAFLDKKVLGEYNLLSGFLFLMGCIALFYNGTRGAWIASIPIILFIVGYYTYKKKITALICIIFLCVGGLFLSQNVRFVNRLATISDTTKVQSNTERILMWKSAWNMFKDHPVLGVGLGQYKENFHKKYILPEAKERQNHAHNNFLQMLAENGIIGFIGFMSLILYFIINPFKRFLETSSPYALMISMSMLALVLQGLTEYNFGNSAVMKCMWLLMGCLVVLEYGNDDKDVL